MKKFLVMGAAVALAMGFSACQNEDLALSKGGETTVTFAINMPKELSSRAVDASTLLGRGDRAQYLYYAIYKSGTTELIKTNETSYDGEVRDNKTYEFDTNLTTTVEVNLVVGKSYDFVFWAAAGDGAAEVYDFNPADQTVTVNYGRADGFYNNAEGYDAFFKGETLTITEGMNETIMLKRPFAQLNIGTDDLNEARIGGINIDALQTSVTVPVYSKFNAFSGKLVGESATQEFKMLPISAIKQKDDSKYNFPVEHATAGKAYEYISLSYLLVDDRDLVDVEFNLTDGATDLERKYNQVPVQRNYRTNIYGSLFTTTAVFTIEIDPIFENPDYEFPVKEISTAEELKAAFKEGGEYVVTQDLTATSYFTGNVSTPTILNLNGNSLDLADFAINANGADITVENGNLNCNRKTLFAQLKGNTNLTLSDVSLTCPNMTSVMFRAMGQTNVNMSNVNVDAAYSSVLMQVENQSDVVIDNLSFTNAPKTGVNIFDSGDLTIKNCNWQTTSFGIFTNASEPTDFHIVNIENCNITSGTAVVLNVPGTFTIKDSNLTGVYHGLFARCGDISVEGGSIALDFVPSDDFSLETAKSYMLTENWSTGDQSPIAALTAGNRTTSGYQYALNLTLNGVNVKNIGTYAAEFPVVYGWGNAAPLDAKMYLGSATKFFIGNTEKNLSDEGVMVKGDNFTVTNN